MTFISLYVSCYCSINSPLLIYFNFPIPALNLQSGETAMAQLNLSRSVFEKIFSIGTSFRLHQATDIRGSI